MSSLFDYKKKLKKLYFLKYKIPLNSQPHPSWLYLSVYLVYSKQISYKMFIKPLKFGGSLSPCLALKTNVTQETYLKLNYNF